MSNFTRTSTELLKVDHVNLSYGNKVVLRDVNASITDVIKTGQVVGQVVCFLGPSGIGKTQLSRIITGLHQPTSGSVSLRIGNAMVPTSKGLVGMVPQNYPLFNYLTVEGNLVLAGKQGGLVGGQLHAKKEQLLASLKLEDHVAKYPSELSGGTKQRVAIARQMMCAGHFMVMDEPFSGLDPTTKRQAAKLIVELSDLDELNTIIVVTHDIRQGMKVADTIWLMGLDKGQPGARIVETFDLAAMDLCWEPDVDKKPDFIKLYDYLDARFDTLK